MGMKLSFFLSRVFRGSENRGRFGIKEFVMIKTPEIQRFKKKKRGERTRESVRVQ